MATFSDLYRLELSHMATLSDIKQVNYVTNCIEYQKITHWSYDCFRTSGVYVCLVSSTATSL